MARIHLVIGPVAAGKSTFVLSLCRDQRALRLNLDDWMAELFSPERPEHAVIEWYAARTARCMEQIWKLTRDVIELGTDVVLEVGLVQRRDRERLYARVDACAYDLSVYVVDAPRELRRERVLRRNLEQGETFSMVVPLHIFEMASDLWEPPEADERSERDIRFVPPAVP